MERTQILSRQLLQTAAAFQGLAALPIMVIMSFCALDDIFWTNLRLFEFIRDSINALISAGIVFLVSIQLRILLAPSKLFIFEATKSALATLLWVWLMLDAAFGPWHEQYGYKYKTPKEIIEERNDRLARGAVSVVLLLVLFYPTLVYSWVLKHENKPLSNSRRANMVDGDEEEGRGNNERTPLLR